MRKFAFLGSLPLSVNQTAYWHQGCFPQKFSIFYPHIEKSGTNEKCNFSYFFSLNHLYRSEKYWRFSQKTHIFHSKKREVLIIKSKSWSGNSIIIKYLLPITTYLIELFHEYWNISREDLMQTGSNYIWVIPETNMYLCVDHHFHT